MSGFVDYRWVLPTPRFWRSDAKIGARFEGIDQTDCSHFGIGFGIVVEKRQPAAGSGLKTLVVGCTKAEVPVINGCYRNRPLVGLAKLSTDSTILSVDPLSTTTISGETPF